MSVFRAYDIRGIAGSELTSGLAYRIGRAHARFTGAHTIVVGNDARLSSEELKQALCRGIVDEGSDVVDIGLCSSPMLYFAVAHFKHPAGVMVTASHNPAAYNGFKLTREHAIPIGEDSGMPEVERLANGSMEQSGFRGRIFKHELSAEYSQHILRGMKLPKLKVVVDAANAMGSLEARHLQLPGVTIVPLHFELDGRFPHHEANPLEPKNMRDLQDAVVRENADLGIAFDGDADRAGFVDERGDIVSSDFTAALIAEKLLKNQPGEKVLYDVRASRAFPEHVRKHGGVPLMCRVGHAFIKRQMRQEDALFAGELSGHYYFRDHYYTESSVMAALHIMSLLKGKKKSELVKPLRKYFQSGELNATVRDANGIIGRMEKKYARGSKISHLDGLRVDYADWWFNVRKSNTEPLLRLNVEAKTRREMERRRDELLAAMRR